MEGCFSLFMKHNRKFSDGGNSYFSGIMRWHFEILIQLSLLELGKIRFTKAEKRKYESNLVPDIRGL